MLFLKSAEVVWSDKVLDVHHGGVVLVDGYIYDEKKGNVGLLKANADKFDLISSFQMEIQPLVSTFTG